MAKPELSDVSVKLDLLRASGLEEQYGQIVSATRLCYVEATATADCTLGAILALALGQPGVPQPGNPLDSMYLPVRHVCCEERIPRLTMRDENNRVGVEITCRYAYQTPADESIPIRGGASLSSVQQQLVPGSETEAITVTYGTDTVAATVDVLDVRAHFSCELVETLESGQTPDDIVDDWVNHINSDTFRGKTAGKWLCTGVEWEVVNKPGRRYRFVYEFEYKPEGHVYYVAYHNADGTMPSDIAPPSNVDITQRDIKKGNGITAVKWHPAKSFSDKFA